MNETPSFVLSGQSGQQSADRQQLAFERAVTERHPYVFHAEWYAANQGFAVEEAWSHFVAHASAGVLDASIWFDAPWVRSQLGAPSLSSTRDIALAFDKANDPGLSPSPYFDPAWYQRYSVAVQRVADGHSSSLFFDYVTTGGATGLSPNEFFEEVWYRRRYPEVNDRISAGFVRSGLEFYLRRGRFLSHDPGPRFSERRYLANNEDVLRAWELGELVCGFHHWLTYGLKEGRPRGADKIGGAERHGIVF